MLCIFNAAIVVATAAGLPLESSGGFEWKYLEVVSYLTEEFESRPEEPTTVRPYKTSVFAFGVDAAKQTTSLVELDLNGRPNGKDVPEAAWTIWDGCEARSHRPRSRLHVFTARPIVGFELDCAAFFLDITWPSFAGEDQWRIVSDAASKSEARGGSARHAALRDEAGRWSLTAEFGPESVRFPARVELVLMTPDGAQEKMHVIYAVRSWAGHEGERWPAEATRDAYQRFGGKVQAGRVVLRSLVSEPTLKAHIEQESDGEPRAVVGDHIIDERFRIAYVLGEAECQIDGTTCTVAGFSEGYSPERLLNSIKGIGAEAAITTGGLQKETSDGQFYDSRWPLGIATLVGLFGAVVTSEVLRKKRGRRELQ